MDGTEFIRRTKKLGKKKGVAVQFIPQRGKGSHGTLYYGDKETVVKRSEIAPGLLAAMLKQLGIDKAEF